MRRILAFRTKAVGRDDTGFTLAELLVSIVLLGLVLSIAWNLHAYLAKVNLDNERDAYMSSEIRTPLMLIDKLVMQNSFIEGGSGVYRLSFLTDMNLDDVRERTVIELNGAELRRTTWLVDGSGTNTTLMADMVLSRNSANISTSEPLFTYLDSDGSVIADTDSIASRTRTVVTSIAVDYNGTTLRDSRTTHLRNRE